MRTIFLLIFSVCICSAASLTLTSAATNAQPAAAVMNFTGEFSVPRFDVKLGTLTGATWKLTTTIKLHWDVVQPAIVAFTDFDVAGRIRFRDRIEPYVFQFDAGSHVPCKPCAPVNTQRAAVIAGKLTPYELVYVTTADGAERIKMPVYAIVNSSTRNILGQVSGEQTVDWALSLVYEYTPK